MQRNGTGTLAPKPAARWRRLEQLATLAILLGAMTACDSGGNPLSPGVRASAAASAAGLTVSPPTASLAVGQTVQLSAIDASGRTVSAKWSSSDVAVATASGSGLVTAVGGGTATIRARSGKASGTATVTVTATSPTVASVEVTPSSASVAVGSSVQLTATVRDASGNVISGKAIAWSSANAAIAQVDAAGKVTGVAPGSTTVSATVDGKAGSSAITVTSPTSGGPVSNECGSPRSGWIWCDDFEQDRLSSYFEYVTDNNSFTRVASVGVNGSPGMRARWQTTGQVSAGNLKLAFGRTPSSYFRAVDAGTSNYREIFWRVYVRNQAGWTGGGGYKFARAIVFANSNWAEAMIAHLWTGGTTSWLTMDPVSGTDASGNLLTTGYNDSAHLTWLGATPGQTPLFDSSHVGPWYCVEAHVRLNDAGLANGIFEFWVNGNPEARRTDLNWLGSYNAYGINAVFLENYWNSGAPQPEERYFDNFVVSTGRIGC